MNCPLCTDQRLEPHHRSGIEIDVCPNCRGLWLDRGELEKLLDNDQRSGYTRSLSGASEWPAPHEAGAGGRPVPATPGGGAGEQRKKRKKSLAERLGDVLDEVLD